MSKGLPTKKRNRESKKLKVKLYNCLACTFGWKHLCINNRYGLPKKYT